MRKIAPLAASPMFEFGIPHARGASAGGVGERNGDDKRSAGADEAASSTDLSAKRGLAVRGIRLHVIMRRALRRKKMP